MGQETPVPASAGMPLDPLAPELVPVEPVAPDPLCAPLALPVLAPLWPLLAPLSEPVDLPDELPALAPLSPLWPVPPTPPDVDPVEEPLLTPVPPPGTTENASPPHPASAASATSCHAAVREAIVLSPPTG